MTTGTWLLLEHRCDILPQRHFVNSHVLIRQLDQATRDARIEEGEGGIVTLENKGSKGCSTLNGDKGKSTINRSTIKSHNSGDSGTGTRGKPAVVLLTSHSAVVLRDDRFEF